MSSRRKRVPEEVLRLALVCVQNAGRSQMAAAFAKRERHDRGLGAEIEILTGGTDPADEVHGVVVEVMAEMDFDLTDETPREITQEQLLDADIVITMGCTSESVCPATWRGDARDWALGDPHGQDAETVREIRDEIEQRVVALFDEFDDRATNMEADDRAINMEVDDRETSIGVDR